MIQIRYKWWLRFVLIRAMVPKQRTMWVSKKSYVPIFRRILHCINENKISYNHDIVNDYTAFGLFFHEYSHVLSAERFSNTKEWLIYYFKNHKKEEQEADDFMMKYAEKRPYSVPKLPV